MNLFCPAWASQTARITTGTDDETRLPFWELRDTGISVRFIQRLPEQTRGFFTARGFSDAAAERIAQSCVFQTIFKNIARPSDRGAPAARLHYNLRDWKIYVSHAVHGMTTRKDWRVRWDAMKVDPAAKIAFEWALFPTEQTYRPGDYNWGMSIFGPRPGTVFDLKLVWQQGGQTRSALIKRMRCAPDITPNAEGL